MKIRNIEVEFDFYNAEQAEIFEKYTEIASQELENINISKMKQSEFIKKVCSIVENCFNNIFGENISENIFNGKKDFHLCIRAFKDLVKSRLEQEELVAKELDDLQKEMTEASTKYSPNRATRRTKK